MGAECVFCCEVRLYMYGELQVVCTRRGTTLEVSLPVYTACMDFWPSACSVMYIIHRPGQNTYNWTE